MIHIETDRAYGFRTGALFYLRSIRQNAPVPKGMLRDDVFGRIREKIKKRLLCLFWYKKFSGGMGL